MDTIKKPTTCREVLDVIDEFLATAANVSPIGFHYQEADNLWNVLTALRGPDDEVEENKVAFTAVIRGTAFPRTLKTATYTFHALGFQIRPDSEALIASRAEKWNKLYNHFGGHVRTACRALELQPKQSY